MESDLNFAKEGDKIILTDVSTYDEEGILGLYHTFERTLEIKRTQLLNLSKQIEQSTSETEITEKRFNQLVDFMRANGIAVPMDEKPKEE